MFVYFNACTDACTCVMHAPAAQTHRNPTETTTPTHSFAIPLHPDIAAAARHPDLRAALQTKVSRERVGIELEGMLSGKDARPALALEALAALGLAGTVFRPLPPADGEAEAAGWVALGVAGGRLANVLLWGREEEGEERWPAGMLAAADADERRFLPDAAADAETVSSAEGAEACGGVLWGLTSAEGYCRPRRDCRLLFLACVLLGWAGATWPDPKGKGGKRVPAVQAIVREALKLRARDAEEVALLHALLPRFRALAAAGAAGVGDGGEGRGVQR